LDGDKCSNNQEDDEEGGDEAEEEDEDDKKVSLFSVKFFPFLCSSINENIVNEKSFKVLKTFQNTYNIA
jgi:hypothetical protein